jgi:hypothetical protein
LRVFEGPDGMLDFRCMFAMIPMVATSFLSVLTCPSTKI